MLFNLLTNYDISKELMCQNKYKKIQLKLKHKCARSVRYANFTDYGKPRFEYNEAFDFITQVKILPLPVHFYDKCTYLLDLWWWTSLYCLLF